MKRALSLTFVMAIASIYCAPVNADWKVIGHRDMYRVVLIDPADVNRTSVYWDALRKTCRGGFCNVIFIGDENALRVSPNLRLSAEEIKKTYLIYTTNSGFSWNCQLRPDADNCFKW